MCPTIFIEKPAINLSTIQLVQRIKSRFVDRTRGWSEFVRLRSLKPEISAKRFYALWTQVEPDRHEQELSFLFKPTHKSLDNSEITIEVTNETTQVIQFRIRYGESGYGAGSCPRSMFNKHYETI